MAVIDKITGINQFHAGDVVTEGVFNQISGILIKAGYIELPPVPDEEIAALVDADSKASAQMGDYAYLASDGKIRFGSELTDEDTPFGVVGENVDNSVLIFALNEANTDFSDTDYISNIPYYAKWGDDKAGRGYSSAIGSYKGDGEMVEEGSPEEEFNIKSYPSEQFNTSIATKRPDDPEFIAICGNATSKQRSLVMIKNNTNMGPFYAQKACYNYNPIADKINMKGQWILPLPFELNILTTNPSFFREKYKSKGNIYKILSRSTTLYNIWTCLEGSYIPAGTSNRVQWQACYGHVLNQSFGMIPKTEVNSYTLPVMRL